jgi:hypothetical protein
VFAVSILSRGTRYSIYLGVAFLFLIDLPHLVLVLVFQTPQGGERWTDLGTNGRPQRLEPYAVVMGIGAVVIDGYIFVVPLVVLRRLKVGMGKKLQVMGVFATAVL